MSATKAIRLDVPVQQPHRIFRSSTVLAGLAFVIIITTATDTLMHATGVFLTLGQAMAGSLFLLALAYRTVYGLAGSYIAARFAPQSPIKSSDDT
jgi:hypothetical protein